jgi:hypothetical protein
LGIERRVDIGGKLARRLLNPIEPLSRGDALLSGFAEALRADARTDDEDVLLALPLAVAVGSAATLPLYDDEGMLIAAASPWARVLFFCQDPQPADDRGLGAGSRDRHELGVVDLDPVARANLLPLAFGEPVRVRKLELCRGEIAIEGRGPPVGPQHASHVVVKRREFGFTLALDRAQMAVGVVGLNGDCGESASLHVSRPKRGGAL